MSGNFASVSRPIFLLESALLRCQRQITHEYIYIYIFCRELKVNRKPKNPGMKPIKAKINSFTRTKLTYFWEIRWEEGGRPRKHGLASMIFARLIEQIYGNKFRRYPTTLFSRPRVFVNVTLIFNRSIPRRTAYLALLHR